MSLNENLKNSKKAVKKDRPFSNFIYDFVKITGAPPTYLMMRPKIYYPFGKPDKKGAILASANHRGFLDPIVVHLVFPMRRINYLATKNLFDTKLKSWFFNKVHCIVADKENFSLSSFHEVVNRLENGKVVVIFPEGGINHDTNESILTFKSGAVLMAHKSGARILPMYIFKRQKWYQRQRIVVGQPIDVSEMLGKMPTMQDLNRASEFLRQKEVELREYFESLPIYKKLCSEKTTANIERDD